MSERSEQMRTGGGGNSPLQTDRGGTTIENTVVQKIAGIAAQEVEKMLQSYREILQHLHEVGAPLRQTGKDQRR